jgi:hypothetical protein
MLGPEKAIVPVRSASARPADPESVGYRAGRRRRANSCGENDGATAGGHSPQATPDGALDVQQPTASWVATDQSWIPITFRSGS